jgi:hypothetical protein
LRFHLPLMLPASAKTLPIPQGVPVGRHPKATILAVKRHSARRHSRPHLLRT